MGGKKCKDVEYWDALTKECMHCQKVCQWARAFPRCSSYCESANCRAKPGHYYDSLLKNCIKCADICGKHPAECSQLCSAVPPSVTIKKLLPEITTQMPNVSKLIPAHTSLSRKTAPPSVTIKRLLPEITTQLPNISTQPSLDDSTILIYSVLAVCTALLFSSLLLVLVVILKVGKTKPSDTGPSQGTDHKQKCVVELEQKCDFPGNQAGMSSKDFLTTSSNPTYRKPSDDSSPTETCVCVHCFPDLRVFGQDNQTPLKAPQLSYQQTVFHRAQVQKGGLVCNEGSLYSSGLKVQQEAAVG
ncbi:tumor necrosis factor receptor superfamily member 13B [Melanotaenia boesemani]|uniref:tumor necrosis factor receptor superfamily member 13B n=1 Tax=Melanotaenia boesemani TaxID=1250792 RepID=UPI001C0561F4|nr:tumor necrosis factor receptor superfamily member 13B [Melanotaenia boesemani]